jgi:glycosyltransferase involved in cell wall biosynthesis
VATQEAPSPPADPAWDAGPAALAQGGPRCSASAEGTPHYPLVVPRPLSSRPAGTGRLRVCYLVSDMPPEVGHLLRLAEVVDLTMVVMRRGAGATSHVEGLRVRYVRALGHPDAPVRQVHLGLLRLLRAERPDLIHVVSEPWGFAPAQCAAYARRHPGVGLVLHGCDRIWWHGSPLEVAFKRRLARFVLRRTTAFAAETSAVFELAHSAGLPCSAPTSQVHTQPRDPEVFRPAHPVEREAARQGLDLPRSGAGVVFLGRLVHEKGPLLLVQAWRELPDDVRARSWLAFAGDGPLAPEIEDAAELSESVYWLGSLRFPDHVLALLHAADVVAVPSYRTPDFDDQSPRTVIEGLLTGAVVIGPRTGGIAVMLGDVGIRVDERDVPSLSGGLVEALAIAGDSGRRARASTAAVARGTERYSTGRVAEQTLELWDRAGARLPSPDRE